MPVSESLFAFLDVETTGLTPGVDEVSEIATILTDLQLNELSRIEMKVKLSRHEMMKPEAARLNGYNPSVWDREAKPFTVWKNWLQDSIAKHFGPRGHVAIGIGQNPYFDRQIIDAFYYKPARQFFPISYHCIDVSGLAMTLKLAGVIDVPNVKLATVMEALGLGKQTHRAMDDCEGAKAVFEKTIELVRKGKAGLRLPADDLLSSIAAQTPPQKIPAFDPPKPHAKAEDPFL